MTTASGPLDHHLGAEELARTLSGLLKGTGIKVAVAESLTGGSIATHLSGAPDAMQWFHGGVVAYVPQVKQQVLGVPPGPVVTIECAEAMAEGVAELLGADLAVAVTGVGGPEPYEGKPPGTVCFSVWTKSGYQRSQTLQLPGGIKEVLVATALHSLEMLHEGAQQIKER